ncbi:MAG: glycosyltransferase family 39 protein [Deltaproteobacteria bacterium]|nr:glycosyltransferase family 39 protein [Deltaproteobacteria bacterium]
MIALLWAAALSLLALCLGSLLLPRALAGRPVALLFGWGLGYLVLSHATLALGLLGGLHRELIVGAFMVLLGGVAVPAWRGRLKRTLPAAWTEIQRCPALSLVALVGLPLLYSLLAYLPETGRDALLYHLSLPRRYLEGHRIAPVEGSIFSHFPAFMEMLFVLGLVQSEQAARLLHVSFALLTAGSLVALSRGLLPRGGGVLAALLFLAIPTVAVTAPSAYVDLALTFYTTAALLAFFRWKEHGEPIWLWLMALSTGAALSVKHTALPSVLVLTLLLLLGLQRRSVSGLRSIPTVLRFWGISLSVAAPWYVKSLILTGNPIFPFFYPLLGGAGWERVQAEVYDGFLASYGMGQRWVDHLLLPWNVSFRAVLDYGLPAGVGFDGRMGPLYFLGGMALLLSLVRLRRHWADWLPDRVQDLLLYGGLGFLFWAGSSQQVRYLVPVLAPSTVAAAFLIREAMAVIPRQGLRSSALGLCLGVPLAWNVFESGRALSRLDPVPFLLGREPAERYLARMLPLSYPMFRWINQELPPGARVFMVWMRNYGFYLDRPYYSDSVYEAYTIERVLSEAADAESVRTWFRQRGFTHLLINHRLFLRGLQPREGLEALGQRRAAFVQFRDRYLTPVRVHRDAVLYRLR